VVNVFFKMITDRDRFRNFDWSKNVNGGGGAATSEAQIMDPAHLSFNEDARAERSPQTSRESFSFTTRTEWLYHAEPEEDVSRVNTFFGEPSTRIAIMLSSDVSGSFLALMDDIQTAIVNGGRKVLYTE
jgi:hypothetical protein